MPQLMAFRRGLLRRLLILLVGAFWLVGLAQVQAAEVLKKPAIPGCSQDPQVIALAGEPVLEVRRPPAGESLRAYGERQDEALLEIAKDHALQPSRLQRWEDAPFSIIGFKQPGSQPRALIAVDDKQARCFELSREELAGRYLTALQLAIRQYRVNHSLTSWLKATALAALFLGLYLGWIRLQSAANRKLRSQIERGVLLGVQFKRLKRFPLPIGTERLKALLQQLRQVVHWALLALVTYLLVPLLLAFFPPTMAMSKGLRGQILQFIGGIADGVVEAIPGLVSVALILSITFVLVRLSGAWFRALDQGSIAIPGFYQEWAKPTARIVSILLVLAGLAAAFPYIPGSGTRVFQGAGLFLGVLAALGSSAIANNVISGLMLIYTRAFREGDRVEINGVTGVVQERALLVTRIQTPRNELVSIPNATVIGASVVNFSFSQREIKQPIAIATSITLGYDVPWRTVHALMLQSAQETTGVSDLQEAYVLQTALNDFHVSYEVTAFVSDPSRYRESLSELHGRLQDRFAEAGIEILSPAFQSLRGSVALSAPASP